MNTTIQEFLLPDARAAKETNRAGNDTSHGSLPTKAAILVIEDNDINMDMMILVLNSLDHPVIPALNGPAGLAIARSQRPSLILCDIQMPELDGFALLNALRADPDPLVSGIPIVAVTALAEADAGKRLMDAGFDGYLGKPVDIDHLTRELRKFF